MKEKVHKKTQKNQEIMIGGGFIDRSVKGYRLIQIFIAKIYFNLLPVKKFVKLPHHNICLSLG